MSKCKWFNRQVEFLGHLVSDAGLEKPKSFMDQVANFPRPKTKTELKRFLGLVNFQRKFVPNCSVIMKPLSQATGGKKSKKAPISWTPEMEKSFVDLKEAIQKSIALAFPDYSATAERLSLFTDASGYGVGACLAQLQNGEMRPIAYASMSFNEAQTNYSTLERELAAIRWALKTFRGFLLGVEFFVHTDHRPLVYLNNLHIVNARIARTLQELSEFNFVIRYTPGRQNAAADAMSRTPSAPPQVLSGKANNKIPDGLITIQNVPGGGDSMVSSLIIAAVHASLEVDVPDDPVALREALVDELIAYPDHYKMKQSRSTRRDLKLMKYPEQLMCCLLYTSPSPRDKRQSRMPSSA